MLKTVLEIEGMACGMCEAHVNDVIRAKFPVQRVSSSHKTGRTEILSEQDLPQEALAAALAETGYRLVGIHTEPCAGKPAKGFRLFRRGR